MIILVSTAGTVFGSDTGSFSISASPRSLLPLGNTGEMFDFGFGGALSADYTFKDFPLFVHLNTNFDFLPFVTKDGISLFSAGIGPGAEISLLEKLNLSASITGGYYYGQFVDGTGRSGGNLSLCAEGSAFYNISNAFDLGVSVNYTKYNALYDGLGIVLGVRLTPSELSTSKGVFQGGNLDLLESLSPGRSGKGLDVESVRFNQVFPVLFKFYDTNPIGKVILFNNERKPVTNISLSYYVDRYMDDPKKSPPHTGTGS